MVRTIECLEREFDMKRNPLPDVLSNVLDDCRPPTKRGRVDGQQNDEEGDDVTSTSSSSKTFCVKPMAEARGHTGFLTFACKAVKSFPGSSSAESEPTITSSTTE